MLVKAHWASRGSRFVTSPSGEGQGRRAKETSKVPTPRDERSEYQAEARLRRPHQLTHGLALCPRALPGPRQTRTSARRRPGALGLRDVIPAGALTSAGVGVCLAGAGSLWSAGAQPPGRPFCLRRCSRG
ncbi:unnamed protein product [Rangifer tarandus platyrhynchus]|uniref:Uncharacterized protein n=1 Tax=Rangifer tarandus platyrhynchus TaxID=3082113 RepID=A0AC59Y4C8_RANTA